MQQQVVQAIHTLYNHPDADVKKQTSSQLETWQQDESAWSVSDAVLHDPSSSMEAQYFCAQTLRTKVQRDFEELPASAVEALRSSLLKLLLRFAHGPLPVRTQLCLAIAAMAAHVPSQQWGQGGIVQWLADSVGRQNQDVALPCMLELLTVLPEEVGSYRPAVRPQRRRQMQDEIIAEAPLALQVLASCLHAQGDQVQGRVLSAFAAWLRLSAGAGLDGPALAGHPLTKAAVEGLKSVDTFQDASDAVCELVACTAARGQPEPQMMPLVQLLVPAVMMLRPRFSVAAQKAQAEKDQRQYTGNGVEEEDDEESTKGMARLFAELGEAYTALIATATPDSMQPVQALLEVAAFPDAAISAISFNFWHRLMRHLKSGFSLPDEDLQEPQSETAQFDEQQKRLEAFRPAYQRLIGIVAQHMQYPSDYLEWQRDDLDDFKHHRRALAETLEDAADVLGWQQTLQLLLQPLQQLAGKPFDWRLAEASLYCVRSISRQKIAAGEQTLVSLFSSLPSMPSQEGPLQTTRALMIGAYSSWLAATLREQPQSQALVAHLLQMLMHSLEQADSSAAAASSIRHLCYECGPYIAASYLDVLLQLYQKVQGQTPTAAKLRERDVQQVVEAVVSVVACLDSDRQVSTSRSMLEPVLQALQQQLQQLPQQLPPQQSQQANGAKSSSASLEAVEMVSILMDRLSILFRKSGNPSLTAASLAHSWPLLVTALTQCSSSLKVVEKTGRAITHALQSSGKASAGLLPQILETVAAQFQQTQHPCMLYIASELLKTYGTDPQYHAALGQLFASVVKQALQSLPQLSDYDMNPDMADDTFLLISRAIRYSPGVVLNEQMLPLILQASMTGVLVQHREACCSILAVVRRLHEPDFLSSCSPEQSSALQAALPPHDPLLMRILLGGVVGALPKSRVDDISDVLFDMLQATKGHGQSWLAAALSQLPQHAASEIDKQALLEVAQAAASGDNRKGQFDDAVDDLSEVCRRNKHSMDASIQSLLPPQLYQAVKPK